MGGLPALGGATEHHVNGTPHFHAEVHVVSAYQYGNMEEIAQKFRDESITMTHWKKYTSWLHQEEVVHKESHDSFKERVDEGFASSFSSREHDGMSVAPGYLVKDANNANAPKIGNEPLTVSNCKLRCKRLSWR